MTIMLAADFTGDGNADIIARDTNGDLWLYPHAPSGFGAKSKIGNGWNVMNAMLAVDFNADGYPDIVARDTNGDLWLYPHAPGYFWTKSKIGSGW